MADQTLRFYESNAAAYSADAGRANPRLTTFLKRCRPGGSILELGTGSGTDARAMLDAGFVVDATDGSAELAAIASKRLGQPVRTMLFEDLEALARYDGIYASASLLHVPRAELGDVLGRVHRALVDGGVVWASFKSGAAEGLDRFGRYYNYLSDDELLAAWHAAGTWHTVSLESWMGSGYDRQPTQWHAVTAIR